MWQRFVSEIKKGNMIEMTMLSGLPLTWKSQGIRDRIPKVKEFCCVKFTFSQVEDPNFENFWWSMPQTPLNGLGPMVELNLGLEKSRESQGISYCLESSNPVLYSYN